MNQVKLLGIFGSTRFRSCILLLFVSILFAGSNAYAATITIDFETEDDFITPLVDGQDINSVASTGGSPSTPTEFGNLVNIDTTTYNSAPGGNLKAAIYDSNGAVGADPDLEVGLGNLLILQSTDNPTQTTSGIYDTPNDESMGGTIVFDFIDAVHMLSIDLVDINGGGMLFLTLTDGSGSERLYDIPDKWTNQYPTPVGYQLLDLTSILDQEGEGIGGPATVTEDAGFDPFDVVTMTVDFTGSAALDNVVFETTEVAAVPEPGTWAMFIGGLAMLSGGRYARKRSKSKP